MRVQLVTQPYSDAGNLHDFLVRALEDHSVSEVTIVVAWAKASGIRRLRDELRGFQGRDGHLRLVLGVDEGGATRQGLELAVELFDEVYVFHDERSKTFHPKLYLATGTTDAYLFVGSNNLTAGGLYWNYEVALDVNLLVSETFDEELLNEVTTYIDRLLDDDAVCKPLDEALLQRLIESPRYRIADETARRGAPEPEGPEDVDTLADQDEGEAPEDDRIFGSSARGMRGDPFPPARSGGTPRRGRGRGAGATSTSEERGRYRGALPSTPRRWWKRLSASDAQHPPSENSSPTGALRLTKSGQPIDQTTYFRYVFFGDHEWEAEETPRGVKEATDVEFDVTIAGQDLGQRVLHVDHATYREADQNNVTTVLHWGPLNELLRETEYTDWYVVLEREEDGSALLSIVQQEPTTFVRG